jgi:CRP-like cAMP-binding protein
MALMRKYPYMSLELIKILSQRIREANDQIIRLTRPKPRQLEQLYESWKIQIKRKIFFYSSKLA